MENIDNRSSDRHNNVCEDANDAFFSRIGLPGNGNHGKQIFIK